MDMETELRTNSFPEKVTGAGYAPLKVNPYVPRKTVLEQAHAVIYGDREKTYGDPAKNLRVIADYWSTHLSAAKSMDIRLTVDDVCGMMILLKQARLANSPKHEDSIVDLIGYAALQDRVNHHVSVVPPKSTGVVVPSNKE